MTDPYGQRITWSQALIRNAPKVIFGVWAGLGFTIIAYAMGSSSEQLVGQEAIAEAVGTIVLDFTAVVVLLAFVDPLGMIRFGGRGQWYHDRLAGTVVIRRGVDVLRNPPEVS